MRKLFMMALLIACAAPFTFAQSTDDYNKHDIGVLYSHNRVDTGLDDYEGFHGVELTAKGNVSRYVGIKGSYSFNRKSFDFGTGAGAVDVDFDIHQILGGVELKDNSMETKVKPFAHAMAGLVHSRVRTTATGLNITESDNNFGGVIGGGIDFRINDRVDFRAIQFDYNPVRIGGETANNFRIGIGFIFR